MGNVKVRYGHGHGRQGQEITDAKDFINAIFVDEEDWLHYKNIYDNNGKC